MLERDLRPRTSASGLIQDCGRSGVTGYRSFAGHLGVSIPSVVLTAPLQALIADLPVEPWRRSTRAHPLEVAAGIPCSPRTALGSTKIIMVGWQWPRHQRECGC